MIQGITAIVLETSQQLIRKMADTNEFLFSGQKQDNYLLSSFWVNNTIKNKNLCLWAFPSSYISQVFQFDDSFEREWIFGWLMVFECQNYREGKHGNFLVHMKTRPLLAYFFFFFSMYCWFIPCSASRFILVSASLALFRKNIHLAVIRNQRKDNSDGNNQSSDK